MKTYFPKEDPQGDWLIVDAEGQTLGRLATKIASVLRGKHKPSFTPNQLCGDFVIVVNAEKVALTGNKLQDKIYTRYTGYQGGLKKTPAGEMLAKQPYKVIEHAVWGMLPKNRLGRKMIRRLKVYAGSQHPHDAQQPKEMKV
ncbi:MAG: 50S ribosomal protein L13 [Deinococcales bacterium]